MAKGIDIDSVTLRNGWEIVAAYDADENGVVWTLRTPHDRDIRCRLAATDVQALMQMRAWVDT